MRHDGYEDYDGEKVEWEDFTNARAKRRVQKKELKKALKKKNKQAFQDWKRKINNGGVNNNEGKFFGSVQTRAIG